LEIFQEEEVKEKFEEIKKILENESQENNQIPKNGNKRSLEVEENK
jgi:hypothetical protein